MNRSLGWIALLVAVTTMLVGGCTQQKARPASVGFGPPCGPNCGHLHATNACAHASDRNNCKLCSPTPPQTVEVPCDNPKSGGFTLPDLAGTITRENIVRIDSKLYYCKDDGTRILLDEKTADPQLLSTAIHVASGGNGSVNTNITKTNSEPCPPK